MRALKHPPCHLRRPLQRCPPRRRQRRRERFARAPTARHTASPQRSHDGGGDEADVVQGTSYRALRRQRSGRSGLFEREGHRGKPDGLPDRSWRRRPRHGRHYELQLDAERRLKMSRWVSGRWHPPNSEPHRPAGGSALARRGERLTKQRHRPLEFIRGLPHHVQVYIIPKYWKHFQERGHGRKHLRRRHGGCVHRGRP